MSREHLKNLKVGNLRHGMAGSAIYKVWKSMNQRCNDPSNTSYPRYGGRGIWVHPRWSRFEAFYEDMGLSYRPGLSLERKDNNGPYSKANCKWSSRKEQGRNKRNNVVGTVAGRTGPLSEAVERFGIVNYQAAWARIRLGWSFEDAVTTPLRDDCRRKTQ